MTDIVRHQARDVEGRVSSKTELKILNAVQFQRETHDRTTDSTAAQKEQYEWSAWHRLSMNLVRYAESRLHQHHLLRMLHRYILDSILCKGIYIEEREEFYDGARQAEFKRYLIKYFTALIIDAISHTDVVGYVSYTVVPHEQFGYYPACLRFEGTQHLMRSSAIGVEFDYRIERISSVDSPTDFLSGGSGGDKSLSRYPKDVRMAYGMGPDNKVNESASQLPFLAPTANSGFEFRLKPRCFTKVFEHPPSITHGLNSRVFSALRLIEQADFFVENAQDSEKQRRNQPLVVSAPPPPKVDPQTMTGSIIGAAEAAGICPTVDTRQAFLAGMNSTGAGAAAAAAILGSSTSTRSANHIRNVAAGCFDALKLADARNFRKAPGAFPAAASAAAAAAAAMGDEPTQMAGGYPIVNLGPGKKTEHSPAPAPHDDPVHFFQDHVAGEVCDVMGVPRDLLRAGSSKRGSSLTNTPVHQNDPTTAVFKRNCDRLCTFLSELCNEAYRHCFATEFASRVPQRPYVPGPAELRDEKERKAAEVKSGKKKSKLSDDLKDGMQHVLRARALRSILSGTQREIEHHSQHQASTVSSSDDDEEEEEEDDDADTEESDLETETHEASRVGKKKKKTRRSSPPPAPEFPEFQVPVDQRQKLLTLFAQQVRQVKDAASAGPSLATLDSLFGLDSRLPDLEAMLELVRWVDTPAPAVPKVLKKSDEDRIRNIGIVVSFPALQSFSAVAFVEAGGYLKPGAYKRAVNKEYQIPLSDMRDTPAVPAGAAAATAAGSAAVGGVKNKGTKGLSHRMNQIAKLSSTSPGSRKDGTPNMPLVNAGKVGKVPKPKPKPAAAAAAAATAEAKPKVGSKRKPTKKKQPKRKKQKKDDSDKDDEVPLKDKHKEKQGEESDTEPGKRK